MTPNRAITSLNNDILRHIISYFAIKEQAINFTSACSVTRKVDEIYTTAKLARELTAHNGDWYFRLHNSSRKHFYVYSNATFTRPDLLLTSRDPREVDLSKLTTIWAAQIVHKVARETLWDDAHLLTPFFAQFEIYLAQYKYLKNSLQPHRGVRLKADHVLERVSAVTTWLKYNGFYQANNAELARFHKVFYYDVHPDGKVPNSYLCNVADAKFFLDENPYLLRRALEMSEVINDTGFICDHIAKHPTTILCLPPENIPQEIVVYLTAQNKPTTAQPTQEQMHEEVKKLQARALKHLSTDIYELLKLLKTDPQALANWISLIDPLIARGGPNECEVLNCFIDYNPLGTMIQLAARSRPYCPMTISLLLRYFQCTDARSDAIPEAFFSSKEFVRGCVAFDPKSVRLAHADLLKERAFALELMQQVAPTTTSRSIIFEQLPAELQEMPEFYTLLLAQGMEKVSLIPQGQIFNPQLDILCQSSEDWQDLDQERALRRIGAFLKSIYEIFKPLPEN